MAEIPLLHGCQIVYVCGPVSSGKSFLIRQWLEMCERGLMYDSAGEFDDAERYTQIWGSPKELLHRLEENPYYYRIAYHPRNFGEDFYWAATGMSLQNMPRWFFVEEVHEVASFNSVHEQMTNLLKYSRKMQLGLVCSSQRIADITKELTSAARMVVLFYTDESRDLEAIRERYGDDVYNDVRNLRPCIFDDETKVCHQEPQCVVRVKGYGHRVFNLGDKVAATQTNNGEEKSWENRGQEIPAMPLRQSSEHPSGQPEEKSPESISDPTTQQTER